MKGRLEGGAGAAGFVWIGSREGGHPPELDFRARQFKQKLKTGARNGTFFHGRFPLETRRGPCVPPLNGSDKSPSGGSVSGRWAAPGEHGMLYGTAVLGLVLGAAHQPKGDWHN